jgi:hypothetical protein
LTQKTIPFFGEKAYCPFYAVDPDSGLVVASVLTTSQELGLRVAARLVAEQAVVLEDRDEGGIVLKRQKDVEIPLPKDPAQSKEDTPGHPLWRARIQVTFITPPLAVVPQGGRTSVPLYRRWKGCQMRERSADMAVLNGTMRRPARAFAPSPHLGYTWL